MGAENHKKREGMKRVSIILAIVGFVVMGSLSLPYIVYADCPSAITDCCIGGDMSKTIAITTFSMCYSWKHFQCRPCHGGTEWSCLAEWYNSDYE